MFRTVTSKVFKIAIATAVVFSITSHFVPPALAVQYQIVYVPVTVIINGKPVVIRKPVVRPVATPTTFELTVAIVGNGTVASTQSGINCAPDCSEKYAAGSAVTLKATPASGKVFAGWAGGGCSGLADCTVTLSAATTVTATFADAAASNPPAKLGDPSSTPFNEIVAVLDRLHHVPKHAIASVNATMPAALVSATMPSLPDIKVLARRDAVIFYLPNIENAADYRAYVVDNNVSFVDTANGKQPRGAVIACAGFRRRPYEPILTPTGQRTRELLQALELPGFVASGNYTVVIEALKSPCPFTGMPGHTDAMIVSSDRATHADIKSFATVRNVYGNEILNGQGAVTPWSARNTSNQLGLAVPSTNTEFPKDPVVIARSALSVTLPFADESVNAPVVDVGSNALFDDFSQNKVMTQVPFGDPWHNYPLGTIPGEWAFWGMGLAHADGENYGIRDFHALQVFERHGRLYNTYGDWEQDVAGTFNFSSLKTLPQELDDTKYVHSFFRVNSDASGRRYWAWTLCGGATREELVDPTTHMPRIQPLILPNIVWAQASNPTAQFIGQPDDPTRYNKECLQLAQIGINEAHWPHDGGDRAANQIATVMFPAGVEKGVIGLAPANSGGNNGEFSTAYSWRLDAAGNRADPIIEPFDQYQPLTHFDIFVRRDRLLVFINGRQGICVNMKSRPLTMKYGLVTYGSLLYHTGAEMSSLEDADAAEPQYRLNTPIADTRIWDAVGHSEKVDIPPQFKVDESTCFAPQSTAVF